MEQRELSPLTCEIVLINASQLAITLRRRNMIYLMCLILSHVLADFDPPAVLFMFLACRVSTATTGTVMLYFYCILGLAEGCANLLSSENVSIKVLAKYLGSFIINFVLRVNHYAIFSTCLVKYISNKF